MNLYRTDQGIYVKSNGYTYSCPGDDWSQFINDDNLHSKLSKIVKNSDPVSVDIDSLRILSPVEKQELWACGVTYLKSKVGRQEESKDSGGADFYGKVYDAERPEVFFKGTPQRVVGQGDDVAIREDSTWDVPEPELTLCVSSSGKIVGYTVGNDMSSRSIEGENPLYLPQAKTYDKCAAVGPCIFVTEDDLPSSTLISMDISRKGKTVFTGEVPLSMMKRTPKELAGFVFRACSFPDGAFIMTGTGIVPSSEFTLAAGDMIKISIEGIGTLINSVE